MATKTISVDLEAYERLRSVRRENESFSETIKRVVKPPMDYEAWLKKLQADPFSEEMIVAVEQQIEHRRQGLDREGLNRDC